MDIKKETFLKKNPNVEEIYVQIPLLMDKETGNVYYVDDLNGKVYDKYIYLTDPAVLTDRPVNILSKESRRKYQRHSVAMTAAAFLEGNVLVKIDDKIRKVSSVAKKKLIELFPFLAIVF